MFRVLISLDKKERIQQAINIIDEENRTSLKDLFVTKHSFKQIAQCFNVPKSTLYDRSKAKASKKKFMHNQNIMTAVVKIPHNNRTSGITETNKTPDFNEFILLTDQANIRRDIRSVDSTHKKYEQQMRLTIKEELEPLNRIKVISYVYGILLSKI